MEGNFTMPIRCIRLILGIVFGVVAAYYVGAMINFQPFVADDLTISAIGFGTLIVSAVIAVCSCVIIMEIRNRK